jgi:hypothetical protein
MAGNAEFVSRRFTFFHFLALVGQAPVDQSKPWVADNS